MGSEPVGLANDPAGAFPSVPEIHPAIQLGVADLRAGPEVKRVASFVVTAVVGNAIKYAGPDAMMSVTNTNTDSPNGEPTAEKQATPTVEVSDNGHGGGALFRARPDADG